MGRNRFDQCRCSASGQKPRLEPVALGGVRCSRLRQSDRTRRWPATKRLFCSDGTTVCTIYLERAALKPLTSGNSGISPAIHQRKSGRQRHEDLEGAELQRPVCLRTTVFTSALEACPWLCCSCSVRIFDRSRELLPVGECSVPLLVVRRIHGPRTVCLLELKQPLLICLLPPWKPHRRDCLPRSVKMSG